MFKVKVRLDHVVSDTYDIVIHTENTDFVNMYDRIQEATDCAKFSGDDIDAVMRELRKSFDKVDAEEDTNEYENYFRFSIAGAEKV